MKFSKSSWHYKFNAFVADDNGYKARRTSGLCQYFWYTVFNLIKILVLGAFGLFLIGFGIAGVTLIGASIVALILGVFGIFFWNDFYGVTLLLSGVFSVSAVIGGIIQTLSGNMKVWPSYISKHFVTVSEKIEEKSPSLVKEYAKTFKTKVCPIIEWKD